MTFKAISFLIVYVGISFLTSVDVNASEQYILHHVRDAVCKTFPCPNWTGIEWKTGEKIHFDTLIGGSFATAADQAHFDRKARANGVLVEGDFTPMPNRLGLNWSSVFHLNRIIRNCVSISDC